MGFGVPIDLWFRKELKAYAYEKLLHGELIRRKLFNPEYIQHILDTHCQTRSIMPSYLGSA
jgi:asparagine synthase (glutamine-hydrolysing)